MYVTPCVTPLKTDPTISKVVFNITDPKFKLLFPKSAKLPSLKIDLKALDTLPIDVPTSPIIPIETTTLKNY